MKKMTLKEIKQKVSTELFDYTEEFNDKLSKMIYENEKIFGKTKNEVNDFINVLKKVKL